MEQRLAIHIAPSITGNAFSAGPMGQTFRSKRLATSSIDMRNAPTGSGDTRSAYLCSRRGNGAITFTSPR